MYFCPNCNHIAQSEDEQFCPNCGTTLMQQESEQPQFEEAVPVMETAGETTILQEVAPVAAEPQPVPTPVPVYQPQYQAPPVQQEYYQPAPTPAPQQMPIPKQYKPLGAWAYFGYSLLFNIPVVGFIFLLVFSFNGSNINRRNFARSYWCGLLIVAAIAVVYLLICVVLALIMGTSVSIADAPVMMQ